MKEEIRLVKEDSRKALGAMNEDLKEVTAEYDALRYVWHAYMNG